MAEGFILLGCFISPERPKPSEFYNPIIDRSKTLEKLTALSRKIPTNQELFEVIADTFVTLATMDFEEGKIEIVGGQKFQAREWKLTDEYSFKSNTFGNIHLGYEQLDSKEFPNTKEDSFIEIERDLITFQKDKQNLITTTKYSDGEEDSLPYEVSDIERKAMVAVLLEGITNRQPAAV